MIWDEIAPTLGPYELGVYCQLFRLTAGWKRAECKISIPRLAERCRFSTNKVRAALRILEHRRLVIRVSVDGDNRSNEERGVVFRVPLAAETYAQREGAARDEAPARRVGASRRAGMKDHERKHEKAPVADAPAPSIYEIRTIGARLFERHRNDLGFDHDRLAELVADALAAQGIAPNGDVIEEAIKGMAVP